MATISSLSRLLFCPFFKKRPAFCTILPFQIGYHLIFLLRPITHFLPLKCHFLTTILPFLAMYFMDLKGFIYTITADIYAFHLAFCSIQHCILHHFTLRLAPKCTAFSTKTHCVQRHIALRLAPKRIAFCCKWPKNGCWWRSA